MITGCDHEIASFRTAVNMMKCLILLSLAAVALAQVPRRCNTTVLWEGRLIEVSPARQEARRAKMAYDALNQRINIREEIEQGNEDGREYYEEWFFHKLGYGLRYNYRTKECSNFTLREPFRIIGVPFTAKFENAGFIGTSSIVDEGVLVDAWADDTDRGRLFTTWTDKGCIPVAETYISPMTGVIHRQFYDVIAGIRDPNIWIPPEECRTTEA